MINDSPDVQRRHKLIYILQS